MGMCQLSNDVMIQILNQLPLTDLLTLSSVSRRWREASQLFIDSSSLCLFYRFALDCAYPAFISLNGHYFQEEKCIKFRRMAEFGNSSLARRVERIASYYPVVLSDPGALPAPLFMMAHKMPNVLVLEYVGNDTQIFYTVPGRPTLRILFPKLTQISMFCDFDLFRMKIESLRAEDYMPKVKLDVKANFLVAVVAAFAEIDRFIECLRADDLVNHQQFKNTVAMRELSSMFPSASLSFDAPAELNVRSVLSTVTELRLVVSEHQSLVQTLTHLPQLKLLELDDERRCTCIVRLPLMPDLISLTLAIHSCALDRRILANVPKVKNLHIYSEECGGVWLELLALNIRNLPDLTTLILNCWEAKKLCCPDDIDDVLPHITSRAERLRSLSLGPGVQPTLNGLRDILNSSNLQIIDAYLCATLDPNETIGPLIEMISRSSVKILKTKVHTSLKQLALLLERFAMTGHEENSKLETKKTSTECLWETESDVVLKSLLVKGLSLFRVRKAPLTTPISRVTKLRPRMTKPSENVKCHIPSLCGPNGPIFTCGTCVTNPKEPCCDLQRLGTDLITDFDCLNISAYSSRAYDKQWQNCQTECNKNGCTAMLAKYVLWVSWNDAELEKHFVRTTDKSINKAPASNKLHWIRFISDDPTPIRN